MKRMMLALSISVALMTAVIPAAHGQHKFHGAKAEFKKLDYDSLAAAAVPLAESTEGRGLAEACLARYGGIEVLQDLTRLRLVYRMVSFAATDSVEVVKTFERGRKHRVDVGGETRILNGDRAWIRKKGDVVEAGAETGRFRAELFSYLTLEMPLALTRETFDGGIRFGTREDDSLGYFYMEKKDSLLIVLGVDPGDSLIKSSEGIVRQADRDFIFVNRFSDHHDVDGIPFAQELVNISMGLEVGRSRLASVEINPDLAPDVFEP